MLIFVGEGGTTYNGLEGIAQSAIGNLSAGDRQGWYVYDLVMTYESSHDVKTNQLIKGLFLYASKEDVSVQGCMNPRPEFYKLQKIVLQKLRKRLNA